MGAEPDNPEMALEQADIDAGVAAQRAYEEDGYVIVRGSVDANAARQLRLRVEERRHENQRTFTLLSGRQAMSVHDEPLARRIFAEFCRSNRALLTEVLGSGARVVDMSVLFADPGGEPQMLHLDTPCVEGEVTAVIFPLEVLGAENGATEFVPGSHWGMKGEMYRDQYLRMQNDHDTDYLSWLAKRPRNLIDEMKLKGRKKTALTLLRMPAKQIARRAHLRRAARKGILRLVPDDHLVRLDAGPGDAFVYSTSLLHRGGANRTDTPRYVLSVFVKEHRNRHRTEVKYFAEEHDDFYTSNRKDCGTLRDYFDSNSGPI